MLKLGRYPSKKIQSSHLKFPSFVLTHYHTLPYTSKQKKIKYKPTNIAHFNISAGKMTEMNWNERKNNQPRTHFILLYSFSVDGSLIPEVQTKVKQRARMVNTEFALKFTTRCKLASKCLSIKKKDT